MPAQDLPEPVRDAITRFRDRFRLPAPLFLNLVSLFLPTTPAKKVNQLLRTVVTGVEDVTRRGSRRFTPRATTLRYFDEFIRQHADFPYRRTYNTINYYQGAHTGGPGTGITFQDRVYLFQRPMQTVGDITVMFHEYMHTFQYKEFGLVAFIKVYVSDWAGNVLIGDDQPYRNIDFENEAFTWEERFRDWLTDYLEGDTNTRVRPLDGTAFA